MRQQQTFDRQPRFSENKARPVPVMQTGVNSRYLQKQEEWIKNQRRYFFLGKDNRRTSFRKKIERKISTEIAGIESIVKTKNHCNDVKSYVENVKRQNVGWRQLQMKYQHSQHLSGQSQNWSSLWDGGRRDTPTKRLWYYPRKPYSRNGTAKLQCFVVPLYSGDGNISLLVYFWYRKIIEHRRSKVAKASLNENEGM